MARCLAKNPDHRGNRGVSYFWTSQPGISNNFMTDHPFCIGHRPMILLRPFTIPNRHTQSNQVVSRPKIKSHPKKRTFFETHNRIPVPPTSRDAPNPLSPPPNPNVCLLFLLPSAAAVADMAAAAAAAAAAAHHVRCCPVLAPHANLMPLARHPLQLLETSSHQCVAWVRGRAEQPERFLSKKDHVSK
jgi:hypothetical protein